MVEVVAGIIVEIGGGITIVVVLVGALETGVEAAAETREDEVVSGSGLGALPVLLQEAARSETTSKMINRCTG